MAHLRQFLNLFPCIVFSERLKTSFSIEIVSPHEHVCTHKERLMKGTWYPFTDTVA